jgi:hypothetical protein
MSRKALIVVIALLSASTAANAHRLDEYLQAARVGIGIDRVNLDIDLTPGVNIASNVAAWIDTNGDREISTSESQAYGRQVLRSVSLSVDGVAAPLQLIDVQAPAIRQMAEGVGTFRLRASADLPATAAGRHHVTLINTHHPESSVYLANALVPADTTIHILAQNRTRDQHSVTIDYEIGNSRFWTRVSWLFAAATVLSTAVVTRRGLSRSRNR